MIVGTFPDKAQMAEPRENQGIAGGQRTFPPYSDYDGCVSRMDKVQAHCSAWRNVSVGARSEKSRPQVSSVQSQDAMAFALFCLITALIPVTHTGQGR